MPPPATGPATDARAPDGDPSAAAGPVPVTARSVIASILLPLERPALPARSLVRCCELFGITEGTTRVALSRMVAAGELEPDEGDYRLTGRMLARQRRQQTARRPRRDPWSGRWLLAVVMAERRRPDHRAALRQVMVAHRLAEVRPGVWTRPDNLPDVLPSVRAAGEPVAGHCLWLRAELAGEAVGPDRVDDAGDAALASRLFDLAAWAAEARHLLAALDRTLPDLTAGDTGALAPCFSVAAAAVRHITADPLLPDPLLPPDWPGPELRVAYDRYETAYGALLADWIRRDAPG